MAVDVTVQRRIRRPREAVAALAMDPANDRAWIGALTSVRPASPGSGRWGAGGLYRLAGPALAAMVRRGIARDLAALQRVAERAA